MGRMISEKQLEANRRNAQQSTGPKTEAGKARCALNAGKDPLTGQVHIMTEEDRVAFNALSTRLTKAYDPQGEDELQLARLVIMGTWRLHRITAIEDNTFALGHERNGKSIETGHAEINAAFAGAITWEKESKALERLSIYEQRLNRTMHKNLAALQALQATRKAREAKAMAEAELLLQFSEINGVAFDPAQNGFVFTLSQITVSLNRNRRLKEAYEAINGPLPSPNKPKVHIMAA